MLQASIGKDGAIQNLRLVSGHPMLAPSAIEAVKQWKYRPYFLNGEPVEVDTQITVNFTFLAVKPLAARAGLFLPFVAEIASCSNLNLES